MGYLLIVNWLFIRKNRLISQRLLMFCVKKSFKYIKIPQKVVSLPAIIILYKLLYII